MVINGQSLLQAAPIKDMLINKVKANGVSHGLAEVGYDITIAESITFIPDGHSGPTVWRQTPPLRGGSAAKGRFVLASATEEFQMPNDLVGIVHDKSSWARRGLSVFNTVIESGWHGFLTLELVYHGQDKLVIPAGSGIAQVVFHRLAHEAAYSGKYQGQARGPQEAIYA